MLLHGKTMDKTWDELEMLLSSRRRTIVDMLTTPSGGDGDMIQQSGNSTDVYKLLTDLYMHTCSVKVRGAHCISNINNKKICSDSTNLPDPKGDPDRHQNCITWSLSRALPLQKILSKSIHKFASNPTDRQTNRQTDKQTEPKT